MEYKMNKEIEKYSDELILFAYKKITDNGYYRNLEWFNFQFSKTEKFLSNNPDEAKPDGESLVSFKKETKLTDDELIRKAITRNINEKLFTRKTICGEFNNLEFTEKGMMKAKAILLNKKEAKKKFFSYLSDKIIIPIVVASLIAIATSFITTKYQNNEINKKVESLEKEIIWLKEQK
jgi:hypothetical protein